MLTQILIRRFAGARGDFETLQGRVRCGMLCGTVSLFLNLFLCALKFAVGTVAGSVAITADAVNNLADAGSSLVTLLGFRFAAAPADSDHPFGHGRAEYVAGVIVSVIVIAAGLNFLKESISRILAPEAVRAGAVLLTLIAGSVLLKAWLFFFCRRIGRLISSQTVTAAAVDSLSDIGCTLVVLGAAWLNGRTAFPADGCAGLLVALLVLAGGGKILRDTISPLLGEAPRPELVNELKSRLLHCPGIRGVHDIIIHNYGPNRYFATAHAEVDPGSDILSVHDMLESAEKEIAAHMPVRLVLHCDPRGVPDPRLQLWRERAEQALGAVCPGWKACDFRLKNGAAGLEFSFDVLIPRGGTADAGALRDALTGALRKYPAPPEIRIGVFTSYV